MNQAAHERGWAIRRAAGAGWMLAALLSSIACSSAQAAPASNTPGASARISIASPSGGQAVAGVIPVAVAYDAGPAFGRLTAVSLWVDDSLYVSRGLVSMGARGTDYLELDTRRLANGQHVIRVVGHVAKQSVATDDCIINVSNGGLDTIAPLVSFRNLMDGDVVSGTFDVNVNAADNDQIQVVSVFVNRYPVLISSAAPYSVPIDTTRYQDQQGKATLKLEAWAYDRSNNLGKAKPLTLHVDNQPNATPLGPDPTKAVTGLAALAAIPNVSPLTIGILPEAQVASPELAASAVKSQAGSELRGSSPMGYRPATSQATAASDIARPGIARGAAAGGELATSRSGEPSLRSMPAQASSEASRLNGQPVLMAMKSDLSTPGIAADAHGASGSVNEPRGSAPTASDYPVGTVRVAALPRPFSPEIAASSTPGSRGEAAARLAEPESARRAAQPAAAVERSLVLSLAPQPAASQAAKVAVPAPAAKPAAGKEDGPLIFAWDPTSKPNENGRFAMRVFRGRTSPWEPERTYTVKRGDTLKSVAQTFQVTPRSILVASGLADNAALRTGMRLRVPGTFQVVLNDQQIAFDVPPRVENGIPLAPFRQIMEHTGGLVLWFPETQTVRGTNEKTEVELKIGSREALVNQQNVTLDRAPFIDRGRTMVPVRFVEEALDLKAEYSAKSGSIYLVRR